MCHRCVLIYQLVKTGGNGKNKMESEPVSMFASRLFQQRLFFSLPPLLTFLGPCLVPSPLALGSARPVRILGAGSAVTLLWEYWLLAVLSRGLWEYWVLAVLSRCCWNTGCWQCCYANVGIAYCALAVLSRCSLLLVPGVWTKCCRSDDHDKVLVFFCNFLEHESLLVEQGKWQASA